MASKDMARCSASPIIREMPFKTTTRYYFTSIRMAAMKKEKNAENDKCW